MAKVHPGAADPVAQILAAHGFHEAWSALPATGLANRIYASGEVILRIATDHPEAVPDALTESVAAPAAHAAGIRTPRLLVFDDSRTIVDRPYSIWERVRGETLGSAALDRPQLERAWREVGQETATLHARVTRCHDPEGYLDTPGFEPDLGPTMSRFAATGAVSREVIREIEQLVEDLEPHLSASTPARCFVHNDLHAMNVMCSKAGGLVALIDWGDAGWGDPALDFAAVPLQWMAAALEGYGDARTSLGTGYKARIVWSQLHDALDRAIEEPGAVIPLRQFRAFLDDRVEI